MIRYAIRNNLLILGSLIALIFQYGCAGLQPLPTAARSGDTIALAIGFYSGLETSEVTATLIMEDDGSSVDLTPGIRSVFNVYADPTSEAGSYSLYKDIGWPAATMLVLDLPEQLDPGNATIEIDPNRPPAIPDQTIEILPDTGAPHAFESWYANMFPALEIDISSMESLDHGIITVNAPGTTSIAAAQFEIDFDDMAVDGDELKAVALPKDIFDQSTSILFYPNITWAHDGDRLRVQVLCPNSTIPQGYFRIHVLYPPGTPDPMLTLIDTKAWADDGSEITDVAFELNTGR